MQNNEKKKFRHELKYSIPYSDYMAMRSRIEHVMERDPHTGPDGRYMIRSIYFDNIEDKALKEKIQGVQKREKFRIRYYNDDLSRISLEKKMKINRLCLKYSASLTEEECRKILAGDIGWMKEHPKELVREFYAKLKYQRLRPRVTVSYIREPFIYKPGNVRVTFDSEIRSGMYTKEFLTTGMNDISATDLPKDMILEVKYDAFLPGIIQDLIQVREITQQSFSKYGICRRFG
jgi:hypothetical protein